MAVEGGQPEAEPSGSTAAAPRRYGVTAFGPASLPAAARKAAGALRPRPVSGIPTPRASIPALFAITTDTLVFLTSNIFAVLGLRALYFLLAAMAEKFHKLGSSLALVLIFVGAKRPLAGVPGFPAAVASGVVFAVVAASMIGSGLCAPPGASRPRSRRR